MKKQRKHKWKYQINIKKKVLVAVILGVFLFVGLGYAIIGNSLEIVGSVEVSKLDKTLYGVFLKEYSNGRALRYEGNHNDSIDIAKSTSDIYYWNANGSIGGVDNSTYALNKNNVVFAKHCWKMIRTTDTGGVKMVYNGEVDVIDNGDATYSYSCATTRGTHEGYNTYKEMSLNSQYYYASNYTYDKVNKTFTLDYTNDDPIVHTTYNDSTADSLYGYYTCRSNTQDATCSSLYYVDAYSTSTKAYCYEIVGTSTYSRYGMTPYNLKTNSPAYSGYMYGDVYTTNSFNYSATQSLNNANYTILTSFTAGTTYYYAENIDYNDSVAGKYALLGTVSQMTTSMDYTTLVGQYAIKSGSSSTEAYYIVGTNGKTIYARRFTGGDMSKEFLVGDDIQVGTNDYTLVDYTPVSYIDWFSGYSSYANKYTCGDNNVTCSAARYMYTIPSVTNYSYVLTSGRLTLAETIEGLELQSPITIRYDEWVKGYNTTYKDYMYSCGTNDTTCTDANLRYIYAKNNTSYSYAKNHYYGKSVRWDTDHYELVDIAGIDTQVDATKLSQYHYTCLAEGQKECSSVLYVFYKNTYNLFYVVLNDENVLSSQDVLDAMFNKNTTDSTIKKGVDMWYERYLIGYEDYLDDVIYCNDRSYDTTSGYTFAESGWNDNGGNVNKYLYFKNHSDNFGDLSCAREEDSFSYGNNKAHLKYKVGLLTRAEMYLFQNNPFRKTGDYYRLMSPAKFEQTSNIGRTINTNGGINYTVITEANGVRPTITINSTHMNYSKGNGSVNNPYVLE